MIGPDSVLLQSLGQVLARFGVAAQQADPPGVASPSMPLLCDARGLRPNPSLLAHAPPRLAPTLVFGVNAARMRARLILSGADDAVSARIAPCELAARMIALHRAGLAMQGVIQLAGFTFDTGLRQACWQGTVVPLMPREFDLLLMLARYPGLTVSRDLLLRTVWRTAFDPGTNSPEVHIFKLRQRLAVLGGAVRIETVKRQGYRLITEASSQG